ncbi:Ig-like domain-containing protein, partial [Salmonella enterica subsp. enterica serovar Kentucky]
VTQHQDEVVAQHQDEVVAQHQDEVVAQHQDEVVAQHQDEVVTQHQDEVVTQHQDEVVTQHQDEVVTQHQDEVVAQHQDEVVAQHQDEVVTQAKQVVPQIDITAGLDIKTDSGIVGDNITNYSRPVLSGTTIVNSKISLFVAGEEYTATADSEGKWSIPVSNELEDGEYNYYITATAPDGRTGNYSDYFIIDTKDPDISFTLNGELRNDITNVTMPLLTGLTEAKSTVSIIIGDSEYYTTSNSVGEWSIQTTRALQEGINNYTVTVIDQAGNNSITQGTVTLDTTILPLTGIKFSHSADDRNSNTYTPTIEGWGEPGAMLTISIGSRSRTLTIPESRKWFFAVPPGFIQKGRTTQYISFKETDPAGNSNQKNIKFNFFTDKPDVSADLSPDSDTGIHGDKITNNLSPTLTGKISSARLSPDMIGRSKISLTIDGVTYSNISVDKNGNWSFKLPVELSPGYIYHYTVNASDFVGNTNSYTSFIKTSPLSGSLDIDSITGQNSIIETSNKLPTLSGTATIGSELVININNTSQKVSVDSSTGAWTYKVTESLGDGKHTFTLVEKNKNGKINTFNGYFIVDTRAPELTASISGIKDGKIHDPNVVFIGKTEPRALVTISVLGGTYQTKADNKGDWSYPLNNKELSVNQTINYSVIASNAAGNRSKASGSFYIDTINLTVGIDDQNSSKDKDVVTNNNKPIFSGVTENDSNVSLKINNDMYSTKADQYGHWSIELQKELPDDTYTYTVTVNKGDKMNYISDKITIDTVALPTHINPVNDFDSHIHHDSYYTNTNQPTLTGISEPHAKIILNINNNTSETMADENGNWELKTVSLKEGNTENNYSIKIIDRAGNISEEVTGQIIFDNTPPELNNVSIHHQDSDNQLVTLSGKTKSNSMIVLSCDDNNDYSTRANNEGEWMLKTYNRKDESYNIKVIDQAGNESEWVIKTPASDTTTIVPEKVEIIDTHNIQNDSMNIIAAEIPPSENGVHSQYSADVGIEHHNELSL